MKVYFTKYLPVEGEIESNYDQLYKAIDPNRIFEYQGKRIKWELNGKITPVKLFLCSRDIQVGDTVIALDGKPIVPQSESDLAISKAEIHYKVIGEVSSEALTWVKDGDEFDEENLTVRTESEWGGSELHHNNPAATSLESELKCYRALAGGSGTVTVAIKCPHCKHFH